jgi:hypothetical protein
MQNEAAIGDSGVKKELQYSAGFWGKFTSLLRRDANSCFQMD